MKLNKWNYETHKYDIVEFPDKYNFKTHTIKEKEIINCPHCLKELEFGDSYGSIEFQTLPFGFGYGVCKECHEKEQLRRLEQK